MTHKPSADTISTRLANLHAFARLYGVVRWFHPSDTAASIDWNRFAVDGVTRIATSPDRGALERGLSELFATIAPTVRIIGSAESLPFDPALHPHASTALELVAWQHEGYGDSALGAGYVSKRRHRPRVVPIPGTPFLALSQSLDATPYRDKAVRLRGKLRATNQGKARLWLRVDRNLTSGFFDNMLERPVSAAAWTDAEIVGKVDPDATQIVIGVLALGSGTSGYDNLEFSAQELDGTWRRVDIRDSGFEEASLTDVWHPGIGKPSSGNSTDGWLITLDHERPAVGASSLRIERATKLITEELFDEMPAAGEAIDIDLGSGLRAHVPLTLYSQAGHTTGDSLADARRGQTEPRTHPTGFDESAGIADVIVTWNVLEHFWPYWDMLPDVDWLAELDKALVDSFDDHSIADHVRTLERLTARAPDGHSFTTCPGDPKTGYLPFVLDYLEGRVVVMSSREKAVQPGDVIVAIDGQPVEHLLPEAESRISGSPQWRRVRGLQLLGVASRGSDASLVLERGGAHLSTRVARVDQAMMTEPLHSTIERYDDGVYYVDLSQATMQQLDAAMDKLAVAPGVIFDVRRRPNSNHQTLSHLLTQTDDSKWMAIPRIIRPDRPSSPAGWKTVGWNLPALAPHIQGRIAFLTGPDAISYAESVMGLVEYYRLGEIVGRPTAGSNGDAAEISQPTGCATRFTGRRVTKPNGARHYLYGVQPTISVSATIAGIRANRDEVLEAALAYVRKAIK